MTTDAIFELLQTAVAVFYKRDKKLVEIGGLERTCASRIAGYLQRLLDIYRYDNNCLSVDCEYGKATDNSGEELIKYLGCNNAYAASDEKKGRVFPDIIVHTRGTHENNMLVIELKGYWHNDDDWTHDENKLKIFTNKIAPSENLRTYFNYKQGIFIALGKNKGHFVRFKNGQQIGDVAGVTDLFNKRGTL